MVLILQEFTQQQQKILYEHIRMFVSSWWGTKETGVWRLREYIKFFWIFVIGQLHVWSVHVACSCFSWSGSGGLVSKSCPTLCEPMGCSPPGSSVHGILQARILAWVDLSSSKGSSWPRDGTPISCRAGGFFTIWATGESQNTLNLNQEI